GRTIINEQHGFIGGRSTVTNLTVLSNYVLEALERRCQVDAIYTDFSKAFDRVNINILVQKLSALGIHGSLLFWIQSFLSGRKQTVKIHNCLSETIEVSSGVPQGGHLSSVFFNCFLNDIMQCFKHCEVLCYCDDIKIFREVADINDCVLVQRDLDRFSDYCSRNGLEMNISKCKTMMFHRTSNPHTFDYHINEAFFSVR
ncbi:MAG: reverse transcriptase family protein, partial [Wolbachia endosymbiont of Pissodes strobi]|nr:reverse transcriptase family protein [Wolbachia endosymbiont of Pissodes strobi]